MVEHFVGNLIEALLNFASIRGEEHECLPKHLQACEHKFEVLSGGGFDVAGTKLKDLHMNELTSRGQESILTCKSNLSWNNASVDRSDEASIKSGKDALTEVIKARVCINRSCKEHYECRREMINNDVGRNRECPQDTNEANRQSENCRLLHFARKTPEEDRE